MVGRIMNPDASTSIARLSFLFDDVVFREYFCLLERVRNRRMAPDLIGEALLGTIIVSLLISFLFLYIKLPPIKYWYITAVCGLFLSIYLWGIIMGIKLFVGKHTPNWEHDRWVFRTEVFFESVRREKAIRENSMLGPCFSDKHNTLFASTSDLFLLFMLTYPWLYRFKHYNDFIFYDAIPGVFPLFPEPSREKIEPIAYDVSFYDDKIVQTIDGVNTVFSLDGLCEIVEYSGFPNLAFLMINKSDNTYMVPIKTDVINGMSWNNLKSNLEQYLH